MKKTAYFLFLIIFLSFLSPVPSVAQIQGINNDIISLAGIWHFELDPLSLGVQQNGVKPAPLFPDVILLPGSTDQACEGYRNNTITSLRLTRLFPYKGVAWYQKEVFIPEDWKEKEICLFLERVHWQSQVWINGRKAGIRESLSVPHAYDITSFIHAGGKNVIRIGVNNNKIYDIGFPHAISEETQTNWNGIIGKMQLLAYDKVHISDVQIYPDVSDKQTKIKIVIANDSRQNIRGTLMFNVTADSTASAGSVPEQINFSGNDSLIAVTTILSLGANVFLWDEFHPNLYKLYIRMKANNQYVDIDSVTFGMREFTTRGTQFIINGRPAFIRADVNSAEFPITGYPAMDIKYWLHIFRVCKAYGLNAMRFHSWCPPEAAFEAADRLGFYLQIENADWRFNVGADPAAEHFLAQEADRILEAYGNHPSFTMMCEGNELVGPKVDSFLTNLITHWKKRDPRHLYTGSSGYPVIGNDDYIDLYGPRAQHWKEGLKGRINAQPYHTDFNYSKVVSKYNKPVISHEVGQWCVYPDFDQITKYTGVLKPYNYALFEESLREHHMLNEARQFTMASGKFQVLLKKEELEALLRTPGLGGYELLQLEDYPGQGTAPVGVVNDFWQPKPYVTAKEFRQFQSPCVLLLYAPNFIFTNDGTFHATAEIANYGDGEIKNARLRWVLKFDDDSIYKEGIFPKTNIPVGSPFTLGKISVPLKKIKNAARLHLTLSLINDDVINHWSIWVCPKTLPPVNTSNFMIAHSFTEKVKSALQNGKTVLLLADPSEINSDLSASFSGISWNTVWSGTPPDKMGILCDPKNPALKYFPTQYYSNWQWWDLVRHSRPMLMNNFPAEFLPIAQMIPDWNKNNKIGLIFEAKVAKGKLLMSSIDLTHDMKNRPVARQMLYSLEKYISSHAFNPKVRVPVPIIDQLFKK